MGKSILQDVNRTVGMIKKAENGEKIKLIEKPSEKRQQAWASQFPLDKVPERFAQITLLKDDAGKWTLAAKPENDRTFAVHPTKEDVSMYFDMMKNDRDEAHINDFRTQFAQKYYSVVAAHPEKEVNLFRSEAPQESLDMKKSKFTNLFLDSAHMGVGGENSWGAWPPWLPSRWNGK